MKVAVEILTGSLFHVDVKDDDNAATVADLKQAIASQQKLPFDRLILLQGDGEEEEAPLDDDSPLADYGIHDGSHIYLFFKLLDDGSSHNFVFTSPEAAF
ncbi:unnamed protein product [Linum tenue]|uniref:Ubiquitin-like domain-containing protein n=1 Tax=Linum tenue TaxID=586396 RepID=A0AAV0RYS0_9ROSI|nr:unnamed protein product [Linum tenue]CAI0625721.1 unnamed protein product [Linum tenue]